MLARKNSCIFSQEERTQEGQTMFGHKDGDMAVIRKAEQHLDSRKGGGKKVKAMNQKELNPK